MDQNEPEMDWSTFLELPLDRELYEPKKYPSKKKPPLRILITDASTKIAYNIIYQLCTGRVFGHDQEIILHLLNSRGPINHKAIVLEMEECGFPCFIDYVLSSDPKVVFKKVSIVVAIATYEEMPGRVVTGTLIYQAIKAQNLARNIKKYATKDCKLIFTGPSTKALIIQLSAFARFNDQIPHDHISCVTELDKTISKALLAAKLKTTTDGFKNIVIWTVAYPDVENATVRMYPPGDYGYWEKKDVPVTEAIQDDKWLYTTFGLAIFRRIMTPHLLKYGKAVAQSTIEHLKILFRGSKNFENIFSMGVITPQNKPYGVPFNMGACFPVVTENGVWKILEEVPLSIPTQLNMIRCIISMHHATLLISILKVVTFMLDYEFLQKQDLGFRSQYVFDEAVETSPWVTKYFVTPNPAEGVEKFRRDSTAEPRKSIFWDDEHSLFKHKTGFAKSTIKFSGEALRKGRSRGPVYYDDEEILDVFNKQDSLHDEMNDDDVNVGLKKKIQETTQPFSFEEHYKNQEAFRK